MPGPTSSESRRTEIDSHIQFYAIKLTIMTLFLFVSLYPSRKVPYRSRRNVILSEGNRRPMKLFIAARGFSLFIFIMLSLGCNPGSDSSKKTTALDVRALLIELATSPGSVRLGQPALTVANLN